MNATACGLVPGYNFSDDQHREARDGVAPEKYFDPRLGWLLDEFTIDMAQHSVVVEPGTPELRVLKFVESFDEAREKSGTIGVCFQYSSPGGDVWREVHVKEIVNGSRLTPGDLRAVAFHEFCHCKLSKGHAAVGNGLMSPTLAVNGGLTRGEWTRLLDQLLSRDYLGALPNFLD